MEVTRAVAPVLSFLLLSFTKRTVVSKEEVKGTGRGGTVNRLGVASDCLTRRDGERVKRLSKTEQEVDDHDQDHDGGNEDEPSLPRSRMVPRAGPIRFEPRLLRCPVGHGLSPPPNCLSSLPSRRDLRDLLSPNGIITPQER